MLQAGMQQDRPSNSSSQFSHDCGPVAGAVASTPTSGLHDNMTAAPPTRHHPLASTGSSNGDVLSPLCAPGPSSTFADNLMRTHPFQHASFNGDQFMANTRLQQSQMPQPRHRQLLSMPSLPAFHDPMAGQRHVTVPSHTLFATQSELNMLEPRAPCSVFPQLDINLNIGVHSTADHMFEGAGHTLDTQRRTISSPNGWEMPTRYQTSTGVPPTTICSQDVRPTLFLSANGTVGQSSYRSPPTSATVSASTGGHPDCIVSKPSSATITTSPSTDAPSKAATCPNSKQLVVDPAKVLPVTGSTASAVTKMLSEVPPELQPVVLAKVAVKGRGGRQPAADPRELDPNMDPRKVRRILANRQSAAKSKLKTRVLLETLKVNKDVLQEQQGCVQEELKRLQLKVQELEQRNKDLEQRLAFSEQQQLLQFQQQQMQQQQQQQQMQPQPRDLQQRMQGPVTTLASLGMPNLQFPGSGPLMPQPMQLPVPEPGCDLWQPAGKLAAPQVLDLQQLAQEDAGTAGVDVLADKIRGWFDDDDGDVAMMP